MTDRKKISSCKNKNTSVSINLFSYDSIDIDNFLVIKNVLIDIWKNTRPCQQRRRTGQTQSEKLHERAKT